MPNLTPIQRIIVALVLIAPIAGIVVGIKTGNQFITIAFSIALVFGALELFGLL